MTPRAFENPSTGNDFIDQMWYGAAALGGLFLAFALCMWIWHEATKDQDGDR